MAARRKRYIVKYDHHRTRYGVYDMASRSVKWQPNEAAAYSQAARQNAIEDINSSINAAISAISTTLTGTLTAQRRDRFRALREQLRAMRDELPTCDDLTCELAHDHSLPTLPRTMED
jgi:hypothetical protein